MGSTQAGRNGAEATLPPIGTDRGLRALKCYGALHGERSNASVGNWREAADRLTSPVLSRQARGARGVLMTADGKDGSGRRVLVVEDEPMIRLLLDDMLTDLGYTMAAEAGELGEALLVAEQGEFDIAILDLNLNGQPVTPVVDVLVARGVPFLFVSGYARRGIPEAHSRTPLLQKPFQADGLARALATVAPKAAG